MRRASAGIVNVGGEQISFSILHDGGTCTATIVTPDETTIETFDSAVAADHWINRMVKTRMIKGARDELD